MIEVKVLSPKEWQKVASDAHLCVFDEGRDPNLDRITHALLAIDKKEDHIVGYTTIQELDTKTIYIQYGGSFPKYRENPPMTYISFMEILKVLKNRYDKITTMVENSNFVTLKFYMKQGFLITGVKFFKDKVYLENTYEFIN